jgi:hypothetical protein
VLILRVSALVSSIVAAALAGCGAVRADAVSDFYRGKTVTVSVGFSPGGGYDLHARVLARHMGKHIPGEPRVNVKNAPGAAGLTLANVLYNTAPQDGTEFGTFDRSIPIDPLIGAGKSQFDALKFNWVGSTSNEISTCIAWHTSGFKTLDDVFQRELVISGTAPSANVVIYPRLMNELLGTKFKIVSGYPGSTEGLVAMERGETQGFCAFGWSGLKSLHPDWLTDKKVNVLVQFGFEKDKDNPDVPLALDYAKTPEARQAIELVIAPQLFARPFVAPPNVPAERVAALREAFAATMKDPAYLEEAQKLNLEVELVTGAQVEALLRRVYATPKPIVDQVRAALQ